MNRTLDSVHLDAFFGRLECQTRFRREGLRFIGEGRSLNYGRDGNLIKDSGWVPTGVEMEAPTKELAEEVSQWLRP